MSITAAQQQGERLLTHTERRRAQLPRPLYAAKPPFEAACARADRALALIAKYGEPRHLSRLI